jgi:hypothetical protein
MMAAPSGRRLPKTAGQSCSDGRNWDEDLMEAQMKSDEAQTVFQRMPMSHRDANEQV